MTMTAEKDDEDLAKRCDSCLQILDPEIPLPAVRLLSINEILESDFVDEKQAVLDPKVSQSYIIFKGFNHFNKIENGVHLSFQYGISV